MLHNARFRRRIWQIAMKNPQSWPAIIRPKLDMPKPGKRIVFIMLFYRFKLQIICFRDPIFYYYLTSRL